MLIKIGPEWKDKAGIKQELKTSIQIGPEFQCLKRQGRNTSACNDDAWIPMFETIRPEFQ